MSRFLLANLTLCLSWSIFSWTMAQTQPNSTTTLPCLSEPGISPDGSEIAFVSGGDIWTVSINGGEARLLVADSSSDSHPRYSPDGTKLAFMSARSGNGDIYLLTLSTGAIQRLTFSDSLDQLSGWSADGKYIYFTTSVIEPSLTANGVWRIKSDGGTAMTVMDEPYYNEFFPMPNPDGVTVAYSAGGMSERTWWRTGHNHSDTCQIHLATLKDGVGLQTTNLTDRGHRDLWPMWSADGRTLYFVSDRSGTFNLFALDRTRHVRQITRFADGRLHWPSVSRDGRKIVFERHNGIWMCDTSTEQTRPVNVQLRGTAHWPAIEQHAFTGGIDELSVAPDGKKIAFIVHGEVFATSSQQGGEAVRVTRTTAIESHVTWSRDSKRLAYVSNRDGNRHIFLYDLVSQEEFRLTKGSDDTRPRFSPDGRSLAYQADARELRLVDLVTKRDRTVISGLTLDRAPFDRVSASFVFSPNGQWIAFAAPGTRGFENVHVVPTAEDVKAVSQQVTFLANTGSNSISWSPDGKFMLFGTGQRTENYQLARIDLVPRTPRFKEDQFRDLFRETRPLVIPRSSTRPVDFIRPRSGQVDQEGAETLPATRPASAPAAVPATLPATSPTTQPVRIVFEGIRNRMNLLNLGFDVDFNTISPDGKNALIVGTSAGQQNLYLYPLETSGESVPRQLTSTPGNKSFAQFSPDGHEVYFLDGGKPAAVNVDSRTVRYINVVAEMDTHFDADKLQVFNQVWTYLRDHFADPKMNGLDWNDVRARYLPRIAGVRTSEELRRVLLLMMGELDASHLNISTTVSRSSVGRLGVRFDAREYDRTGRLKVESILPLSPAELAGIKAGEFLVGVDHRRIVPNSNVDELLIRKIGKRVVLRLSPDGELKTAREVVLAPVDLGTERSLAYRHWVESRRAYVEKASGGKLGYVHLADMSETALSRLNSDLDSETQARQGVVVDVRGNRGGFVNGFAIDVFARKNYLTMIRRGFAPVPSRVRLGQRLLDLPTVLVTNRNTYSDGEDFTEAYRALKLGKVVGEPTGGSVIFTSQITLLDGTRLGLPHTQVIAGDGKRLEGNPRPVDIEIRRVAGESLEGKDSMLDGAVKVLMGG